MSATAGVDRPWDHSVMRYHNMMIMRLTLICFGRLAHAIILRPFMFHDERFHCNFRPIAVDRGRHRLRVD